MSSRPLNLALAVSVLGWWIGGCGRPTANEGAPPPPPPEAPVPRSVPGGPLSPAVLATIGSCGDPAPAPGALDRVRLVPDLPYASVVEGRERHLDLYLPEAPIDPAARHPLIVLFHGGGWSGGDEGSVEGPARAFAARGVAVAAVRYRLASGRAPARFPAPVADARCAVRFVRQRLPRRFNVDVERVYAGGFSAGGHLAAMLATASDDDTLDDGSCPIVGGSVAVQGAFAWYAPLDLRGAEREAPRLTRIVSNFLGAHPDAAPQRAARASPVLRVDPADPPLLLVHGTADDLVVPEHSREMARAAAAAGVPYAWVEVGGLGHGFRIFGGRPGERRGTCASTVFVSALAASRPPPVAPPDSSEPADP